MIGLEMYYNLRLLGSMAFIVEMCLRSFDCCFRAQNEKEESALQAPVHVFSPLFSGAVECTRETTLPARDLPGRQPLLLCIFLNNGTGGQNKFVCKRTISNKFYGGMLHNV